MNSLSKDLGFTDFIVCNAVPLSESCILLQLFTEPKVSNWVMVNVVENTHRSVDLPACCCFVENLTPSLTLPHQKILLGRESGRVFQIATVDVENASVFMSPFLCNVDVQTSTFETPARVANYQLHRLSLETFALVGLRDVFTIRCGEDDRVVLENRSEMPSECIVTHKSPIAVLSETTLFVPASRTFRVVDIRTGAIVWEMPCWEHTAIACIPMSQTRVVMALRWGKPGDPKKPDYVVGEDGPNLQMTLVSFDMETQTFSTLRHYNYFSYHSEHVTAIHFARNGACFICNNLYIRQRIICINVKTQQTWDIEGPTPVMNGVESLPPTPRGISFVMTGEARGGPYGIVTRVKHVFCPLSFFDEKDDMFLHSLENPGFKRPTRSRAAFDVVSAGVGVSKERWVRGCAKTPSGLAILPMRCMREIRAFI